MRRSRWLALALVAVVAVGVVGVMVWDRSPRLTPVGGGSDGWFGMRFGGWTADRHRLLTSEVIVCVDRPGRVEIVEVGMKEVEGDLRVDAFAVRPYGPEYPDWEDDDEILWDVGFVEGDVWVDALCPEDLQYEGPGNYGRWMHLGIQFSNPSDATARGATLQVFYRAEGSSRVRVMELGFGLVLCEYRDSDDPRWDECGFIEDEAAI